LKSSDFSEEKVTFQSLVCMNMYCFN